MLVAVSLEGLLKHEPSDDPHDTDVRSWWRHVGTEHGHDNRSHYPERHHAEPEHETDGSDLVEGERT